MGTGCLGKRKRLVVWIALGALAVGGGQGCSGGKKGDPNGRVVTGKVTYRGNPVEGASVTFMSTMKSAFARTDAEGKFKLSSADGEKVAIGEYRVAIFKKETPPVAETSSDPDVIPDDYVSPDPNAPPPPDPKDLLPVRYADAAKSGLTASVTADGKNDFEFPLTD